MQVILEIWRLLNLRGRGCCYGLFRLGGEVFDAVVNRKIGFLFWSY